MADDVAEELFVVAETVVEPADELLTEAVEEALVDPVDFADAVVLTDFVLEADPDDDLTELDALFVETLFVDEADVIADVVDEGSYASQTAWCVVRKLYSYYIRQ